MENKQHKFEVIEKNPVQKEQWDELNHNNELVDAGFSQEDFREIIVKTEYGELGIFAHLSILDVPDQLDYAVQHAINAKLENGQDRTEGEFPEGDNNRES
jgi:hypothetical protein